jgi:biopolymer transport protein ExbD
MKKTLLLNIILIFLFSSCNSQTERAEIKIMECFYQSYPDNGTQLKQLISEYEKLLIDEKIIESNSGESYRSILKNIADGIESSKTPSKSFVEQIKNIEKPDSLTIQKCQQTVASDSSTYDMTKLKMLETAMMNVQSAGDLQPELIAESILNVLTKEDFELDFYKLRTFFIFEMLNSYSEINRLAQEPNRDYDLENAFKIHLNGQNQIFVNGIEIKLTELKPLIIKYYRENKSRAVIALKTERKTMYSDYIAVQNEITSAVNTSRENLSKKKFGKEYENLSEEEKKEIDQEYPKSISIINE